MLGLATDKLLHFGVCFIINFMISTAMPSQSINGIGFSVGLSLGKEYGDSKAIGNTWDNYDLMADAAGIAIGTTTGLFINSLVLDGIDLSK